MKALPNVLSSLRLALAPALPFAPERWWVPIILAAGCSDWLDGFLARRYQVEGWIGGLIDSVADKAFVLSALITLSAHGHLEAWRVLPLLVRDVSVASFFGLTAWKGEWFVTREIPARLPGKATTVTTFAYLLTLLIWPQVGTVHLTLFAAAVVANVWAAFDYFLWFQGLRLSRT